MDSGSEAGQRIPFRWPLFRECVMKRPRALLSSRRVGAISRGVTGEFTHKWIATLRSGQGRFEWEVFGKTHIYPKFYRGVEVVLPPPPRSHREVTQWNGRR